VQKSIQEFISSDDDEEEDDVSPLLSSLSITSKSNKLLLPFPSAPTITRPPSAQSESVEYSKTRRNSAKKRRRIGIEENGDIESRVLLLLLLLFSSLFCVEEKFHARAIYIRV
jgi:hypothetical protein